MNVLIQPLSSSITFSNDVAGASTVSLSTFPKLYFDGAGALGVMSTNTALSTTDKFKVDATNRLFTISDAITGTVFDITNYQGLPLVEVYSTAASTLITMGTYGSNAFVINNDKTGLGTASPNEKLTVVGGISATGNLALSGITCAKIGVNTAPTSYTADINGTLNASGNIVGLGLATITDDIEVVTATKGLILKSPSNARWRITVTDSGALSTTAI